MTTIRIINEPEGDSWDAYVRNHEHASVYHFQAFKRAIERTYGHRSLYIAAFNDNGSQLKGILPLFKVQSILFGSTLVSIPFCDYGGILSDDEETGALLLDHAISLVKETKCASLELRQTYPLSFFSTIDQDRCQIVTSKVRMRLALPESEDKLFSSFPDKLRSQIRKPQKEGCTIRSGGAELLDDFYSVFVYNMRDLGSPVHPKKMMANVLDSFGSSSRLFVVYKSALPIACSLVIGAQAVLVNPWASFNKTYRPIAPNMLLYWGMLEYAIANGYQSFDFGRSTTDEGTFKFKKQWGAEPEPLTWYYYFPTKKPQGNMQAEGNKKELFIKLWQKLPLGATRVLGPMLRKQIPL